MLRISPTIITLLELMGILVIAYIFSWSEVESPIWDFSGIGILIVSIVLIPLGILGFIQARLLLHRNTKTAKIYFLLIMSVIVMIPPFSISVGKIASPILTPVSMGVQYLERVKEEGARNKVIRVHHAILSKEFQNSQVIKKAYSSGYLVLESGKVIFLDSIISSPIKQKIFFEYAQENLVGKEVTLKLVELSEFSQQYTPIFMPISDNKFEPILDHELGERYGAIPVLLYMEDVLVNEQYDI